MKMKPIFSDADAAGFCRSTGISYNTVAGEAAGVLGVEQAGVCVDAVSLTVRWCRRRRHDRRSE